MHRRWPWYPLLLALAATAAASPWFASPEVIRGENPGETISGVVFHDRNGDGSHQPDEPGLPGVLVSNGQELVVTDATGRYEIAARPDMNLMIVQPGGWQVPTNRHFVPQFFYIHKPGGSPRPLRFGGLADTGPLPARINFPLRPSPVADTFNVAAFGDPQTYSNREVSYLRDGLTATLLNQSGGPVDAILGVGDIVGDDLDLLTRLLEIGAVLQVPQWFAFGNHDLDFDAPAYEHSADTWRRLYGPTYYAFEIGQALFVILNNVNYPVDLGRTRPGYLGVVDEVQMEWFKNLIAHTPQDRLVVLAHHIPFVSFVDATSKVHQTREAPRIYEILAGREALSLAGHTHTTENHAPGQFFAGWSEAVGVGPLPFRHLLLGAASGAWFQGDFNTFGLPMALQRMGAPPGYFQLSFQGNRYRERYIGTQFPDRDFWVGFNTPSFRTWFTAINDWRRQQPDARSPLPPYSINDLADTRILTPADLKAGVEVTVNVWGGSAETRVAASINGGPLQALTRTQEGRGEAPRVGAEWADPFATQRQLSVARFALRSEHGDERAQGWEAFRGSRFGPDVPQPMSSVADRNMHLWRMRLPVPMPAGSHRLAVQSTDRHGRVSTEHVIFEVRAERPPAQFRHEPWAD